VLKIDPAITNFLLYNELRVLSEFILCNKWGGAVCAKWGERLGIHSERGGVATSPITAHQPDTAPGWVCPGGRVLACGAGSAGRVRLSGHVHREQTVVQHVRTHTCTRTRKKHTPFQIGAPIQNNRNNNNNNNKNTHTPNSHFSRQSTGQAEVYMQAG